MAGGILSGRLTGIEKNILPIAGNIPGLATAEFSTAAQEPFRGLRFVVPSYLASSFDVVDIKVGRNSQLAGSTGGVPAAVFSETAYDTGVFWDLAEVGKKVNIQVRNKTPGMKFFSAALLGDVYTSLEESGESEADEEILRWLAQSRVPRMRVRRRLIERPHLIERPRPKLSLVKFGGWR